MAKVKVTNRDNSVVGYYIPELNIKRNFTKGEVKNLEADELRALAWTKGGRSVIKNHLIIEDPQLVQELLGEVEPEYYYTEKDVVDLLVHGTEDQLMDALDFAPDGAISLIKDKAVDLKLNDVRKREIITKATGFDVDNAIRVNRESEIVPEEAKTRRAAPITASENQSEAPARRATAPKIKIATNNN